MTTDEAAARTFLDTYAGTGAFWNATTRLLDGYKLRRVPETGINVDHVPGPRGPVVFTDLVLRQFVVVPASTAVGRLSGSTSGRAPAGGPPGRGRTGQRPAAPPRCGRSRTPRPRQ